MEREKIATSLKKKGFVEDIKGRDHRYYHHQFNGKRTGVRTKLSMGSKYKRLGAPLLAKIKKQLKLDSSEDLADLVNCPMTQDDYIEILKVKDIFK